MQGGFGKVLLVRHHGTSELLAMKVMHKRLLALRDHVAYSKVEREVMAVIDHPYLVGLKFAFQTADKLYLVMPYMAGGELFAHLNRSGALKEKDAKVYVAEMVLALEHLHSRGIIHRDLKVSSASRRFVCACLQNGLLRRRFGSLLAACSGECWSLQLAQLLVLGPAMSTLLADQIRNCVPFLWLLSVRVSLAAGKRAARRRRACQTHRLRLCQEAAIPT
jgi:serine/threonine protein kinase